jgi:hypothetical protein
MTARGPSRVPFIEHTFGSIGSLQATPPEPSLSPEKTAQIANLVGQVANLP